MIVALASFGDHRGSTQGHCLPNWWAGQNLQTQAKTGQALIREWRDVVVVWSLIIRSDRVVLLRYLQFCSSFLINTPHSAPLSHPSAPFSPNPIPPTIIHFYWPFHLIKNLFPSILIFRGHFKQNERGKEGKGKKEEIDKDEANSAWKGKQSQAGDLAWPEALLPLPGTRRSPPPCPHPSSVPRFPHFLGSFLLLLSLLFPSLLHFPFFLLSSLPSFLFLPHQFPPFSSLALFFPLFFTSILPSFLFTPFSWSSPIISLASFSPALLLIKLPHLPPFFFVFIISPLLPSSFSVLAWDLGTEWWPPPSHGTRRRDDGPMTSPRGVDENA